MEIKAKNPELPANEPYPLYYKDVFLVTKDHLYGEDSSLLLSEDKLIFVAGDQYSSDLSHNGRYCRTCKKEYPLKSYQFGDIVTASCFHPEMRVQWFDDPGGIQFQKAVLMHKSDFPTAQDFDQQTRMDRTATGWRAVIEPLTPIYEIGYDGEVTAGVVKVVGYRAFGMSGGFINGVKSAGDYKSEINSGGLFNSRGSIMPDASYKIRFKRLRSGEIEFLD